MYNKKNIKKNQKGGALISSNEGLLYSFLPCKENKKVQYKEERPACHLWNTPQCGYGCGTCAGSDSCLNYPYNCMNHPFGQVGCDKNQSGFVAYSHSQHGAPVCNLQLDMAKEQNGGGYAEVNEEGESKCGKNGWHSQQCKINVGADTICQDCEHYNKMAKNYRHMLTGATYPFCK